MIPQAGQSLPIRDDDNPMGDMSALAEMGKPGKIEIKDEREKDAVTGLPVDDKYRMHATVDADYLKTVIDSAKKYGVDPYTLIAINLQETGLSNINGFHQNDFTGEKPNEKNYHTYDYPGQAARFLKEKFDLANKLGKKSEEERIQAWNGYGKLTDKNTNNYLPNGQLADDGVKKNLFYGIDLGGNNSIDMNKNPVYGKRVIDLRENIIKKQPEIVKMIEGDKPEDTTGFSDMFNLMGISR